MPSYGRGVDWFAVRTFSRLLSPRETVNAGGVAGVEVDEASGPADEHVVEPRG